MQLAEESCIKHTVLGACFIFCWKYDSRWSGKSTQQLYYSVYLMYGGSSQAIYIQWRLKLSALEAGRSPDEAQIVLGSVLKQEMDQKTHISCLMELKKLQDKVLLTDRYCEQLEK